MSSEYNTNNVNSNDFEDKPFYLILSVEEKLKCLEEILSKLKKILYVYDRSKELNSKYSYKVYCGGILIYISSSNSLFDGELVNIVVNLKSIIDNELDKQQIKRIVFECRHEVERLIDEYSSSKELK